ncbi:hypothetical protein F5148DRAFT_1152589 [Russula earlei]|uniref:Uncharacterized protein n=1 Tax=Russula earlei TaxID=71964 RepID=A0ACC0TXB3_9AGAM|nr:hypothetical protein F5148DRAFT_1152589 [Russula earlei]
MAPPKSRWKQVLENIARWSLDLVTTNTLPDDVLVEIFHFYLDSWPVRTNEWHTLVHVCQRWRLVVFASPRHLNPRLEFTGKRPMSEVLDFWPAFPVVISQPDPSLEFSKSHPDFWGNVAAALESEHHHRICEIHLPDIPASHWERLAAAVQKPFLELTYLWFSTGRQDCDVPSGFVHFCENSGWGIVRFQEFQTYFCLQINLSCLTFGKSPILVTFLPRIWSPPCRSCPRLTTLYIQFRYPRYPESRPRPPLTRSVLPALTDLGFRGVHKYLEDLLAQIEAPILNRLHVSLFIEPNFVLPQLHQLISQVESFKTCDRASVRTSDHAIRFSIFRETPKHPELSLEIKCRVLDRQHSSLARVCNLSFLPLSTFVQLDIRGVSHPYRNNNMENTQWLELLDPFTAVNDLRLSDQSGRHVCQALEELVDERVTEDLPALQNIFLKGFEPLDSGPKCIERFVAARELSGHPVAVHRWE